MNIQLAVSLLFFIVALASARYKSRKKAYLVLNASLVVIYLLVTITYLSANFFTGHGVDESVIYTIVYGLGDAGFGDYIVLIAVTTLGVIATFAIGYFYYRFIKGYRHPAPSKIKGFIHNTFFILAFLFHPLFYNLYQIYSYRSIKHSNDFYKYYKEPKITQIEGKKMNLVYIVAESFERTYFDERLFPNLITYLRKIKKHSIEFTDVKQVISTGWTIGGLTATQCAIPLFTPSDGNSMSGSNRYLPKAVCLGDILHKVGYHQVYIQGASTKFSGKDKFFKTHHYDEIYGRDELKDSLRDKNYLNAWGLYDDSTFDIAYSKYEELSKSNRAFSLVIMTLDTHHPEGHISKTCKEAGIKYGNGDNPILNAVKCSDYLISKLIYKIEHSKYAKNTIIAMTSDHLAKKNTATSILNRGDRKDFVMLIDPRDKGEHIIIDKPSLMFDQASVILNKLGIKTDLGLGRNILNEDSLAVKFKDIDKKLYSWREDILKFWEFPKLPSKIKLNLSDNSIDILAHKYKLPLFLEIDMDKSIKPHFEFFISNKHDILPVQISKLPKYKQFIWIDRCQRINYVYGTSFDNEICIANGTLEGGVRVEGRDEDGYIETKMNQNIVYAKGKSNEVIKRLKELMDKKLVVPVYSSVRDSKKAYHVSLSEGIDFKKEGYPDFIRRVWGISDREWWGRWSDANLAPSVKFKFKKPLPKEFVLELKIGAFGKNIGKEMIIKVGNITKKLKILSYNPKVYKVKFEDVKGDTIEFIPPSPQSTPKDSRKLGVSLISLKIIE